ncbi:MAG: hypothetical protein VX278_14680 [Myxococcota bacterium]|nr:hypothetical protein [Myxococcota bacterium]
MGTETSWMGDDQLSVCRDGKNNIGGVIGLNSHYGLNHITEGNGFEWCHFSWTCSALVPGDSERL